MADFCYDCCLEFFSANEEEASQNAFAGIVRGNDRYFCLCVGCHVFSSNFSAHKTPAEFVEWAIEKRGKSWYDNLKDKNNSITKYIDKDFDFLMQTLLGN